MNSYQTPLTEELEKTLPKEVYDEIIEFIASVKFIDNLIQPEEVRGFIKDKPIMTYTNDDGEQVEYEDGRREIDLSNPHILEGMDFFREKALFFEKTGKYTNIIPNSNPKSDYANFWREEVNKWRYGLVREDGEWIPGELYFYWNYSPIWLVEKDKQTKGNKKGNRVKKFPKPWLGDYLFYHYVSEAKEKGKHGKLLKTRGIGFPGPISEPILTTDGFKTYGDIKVNDNLIDRKGNPTKVTQVHKQDNRIIYELTLNDKRTVRCAEGHLWSVFDKNKGTKNKNKLYTYSIEEIIKKGLYWKNKKGNKLYKYYIPDLLEPVKYSKKEFKIDPYVIGALIGDGSLNTSSIKIASIDNEILDNIQKLIGNSYKLVKDKSTINYLLTQKNLWEGGSKYKHNKIKNEIINLKLNVNTSGKFIPDIYKHSSINQRLDLVKGLMDTDGSISLNGNLEFSNSNKTLIDDLAEVLRSLGIACTKGLGRKPRKKEINGSICNIKQEYRLYIRSNQNLFNLTRKSEKVKNKKLFKNSPIVNIKKLDYIEECVCFTVDNKENLYLTTDFIPTHNSFKAASWSPRNLYCYPGSGNPNFHLASEKGYLSGDKGIWGKVLDTLDWLAEHTPLSRMRLVDGKRSMEIQLGYEDEYGSRKGLLSSIYGISLKDNPDKARGIRGPFIHYEEDGLFPNLEKAWNVNRKAVEDGGVASGFMLAGGTGGVEGASFEGSEKLFYNPNAYNILGVPNVYDRNSNPQIECGFFWGAYLNRNRCYDENQGEPDIIKALIEICTDRFKVKYSSSDSSTITQKKAEEPITPQEAIMRTEGTVFPVADLKTYFEDIYVDKENFLSNHYVGDLITESNGNIKWKINSDITPLRRYDLATNDKTGAVEIFEMPKKNGNGIVFRDRYIAGIDPVDSDTGNSLYSVFIMDSWTDRIVAEYTGRPKLIKEAYNITIKLLLFYNAEANYESNLKGLFTHFSNRNCLYLLCDTPQILKDMELVKLTGQYGNKAKGTHASAAINKLGRDLQAEWMMSDSYGEDNIWNLHKIRSFGYIEEAIKWNADGNFDRISSMGMLMILREERKKRTQQAKENKDKKLKQLSEDPFFSKNYTNVKDRETKRAMEGYSDN
jgi:hypothetical protein